jgi:hypothetical protein
MMGASPLEENMRKPLIGAPFYKSLNDAQKERFKKLAHFLRPHHRGLYA